MANAKGPGASMMPAMCFGGAKSAQPRQQDRLGSLGRLCACVCYGVGANKRNVSTIRVLITAEKSHTLVARDK